MRVIIKLRMGYNGLFAIKRVAMGRVYLRNDLLDRELPVSDWKRFRFASLDATHWEQLAGSLAKVQVIPDEARK